MSRVVFTFFIVVFVFVPVSASDDDGVVLPSKCEVCKFMVKEIESRLKATESKRILEAGYKLDHKKTIPYETSETRLIEVLHDPPVCDRLLKYNLHKQYKDSRRFAKGESETFSTLKNLVNKGVKVDIGIPYELWDETSVEVASLNRQCFSMLSDFEETIEDWYFSGQKGRLIELLCRQRLPKQDQDCLSADTREKGDKGIEHEEL